MLKTSIIMLLINNKRTMWMDTMTHYPPIMKIYRMKMNRMMEIKQSNRKTLLNDGITILMETKLFRMNYIETGCYWN